MSREPGLLLAFDYGLKRIGVATGNRVTRTASPVATLEAAGGQAPWPAVDALIAEWRPAILVVGDPGPGGEPRLLEALAAFAAGLAERYGLPVERADERLSSADAESRLRAGRAKGIYNRRLNKDRIDRHAACLIAEQWMLEALERD